MATGIKGLQKIQIYRSAISASGFTAKVTEKQVSQLISASGFITCPVTHAPHRMEQNTIIPPIFQSRKMEGSPDCTRRRFGCCIE